MMDIVALPFSITLFCLLIVISIMIGYCMGKVIGFIFKTLAYLMKYVSGKE